MNDQPIAVFDSGLGGLNVVRALRRVLPERPLVYFGDTARVPYGTKSAETVIRFTEEIVRFLLRFDPCCIVAACNTASAVAVPVISPRVPVPLVGVVAPGAKDAVEATKDGDVVAILATAATVASNAYRNTINRLRPRLAVVQKACPLLVPLVEEGRSEDDPIVRMVVREYLEPIRRLRPTALVLGCTHYPGLKKPIAAYLGEGTKLIDSARSVADHVGRLIGTKPLSRISDPGRLLCYVSDNPQHFQSVGTQVLGEAITDVARVCPEEFAVPSRTIIDPPDRVAV